ncbi:hypothetical protein ACQ4M3_09055 [Leptolyngbya sp. AN03gr2]|uniref:hypothetical protein n=1 Tax=unclassified Leptolyngbya TaxID=2650499 RepID=UPI003D310264
MNSRLNKRISSANIQNLKKSSHNSNDNLRLAVWAVVQSSSCENFFHDRISPTKTILFAPQRFATMQQFSIEEMKEETRCEAYLS